MITVGCIVVALASLLTVAQTTSYTLSDWSCGIVVWAHELPDSSENFIQRLTEAAETAFGFWGYDVPMFADEPYDEAKALRVYDPALGAERVIPPLRWNNREISPVVVFAFQNEISMREVLGLTGLFGAAWCRFPMSQGFPDAEPWIWEIGAGSRNMICPWLTPIETLIHEDAHWFTTEWGSPLGVAANDLPNYIIEGIAETTYAPTKDANDVVYDRLMAISWAKSNCLSGSIDGAMRYPVGESLVSYLVETLGTDGFLATLMNWAWRPVHMAGLYQADWRTSLGLPASCPE
jgi:hypothetical protein